MPGFRWLTVSPPDNYATQFILMLATSEADREHIGRNDMCVPVTGDCVGDCIIILALLVKQD